MGSRNQISLKHVRIGMILVFLLMTANAFGEVLDLESGDVVGGIILERGDEWIKIDTGLGIPITYYLDEIKAIDGEPVSAFLESAATSEPGEPGQPEIDGSPEPEEEMPEAVEPSEPIEEIPEITEPREPIEETPEIVEPPEPVEEIPEVVEPSEPVEEMPEIVEPPEPAEEMPEVVEPPEPIEEIQEVVEPPKPIEEMPEIAEPPEPVEEIPEVVEPPEPVEETIQEPTKSTEPEVEPIEIKAAIEPPQAAPMKDKATLEGVELFKKEVSPSAIKPKEAPLQQPKVVEEPLNEKFPTESKPKNEWIKLLSQRIEKYSQTQMAELDSLRESIQKKWPFIRDRLYKIPVKVRRAILILGAGILTFLYFVICPPLMIIARKLQVKHAWLIWLPVIQIFYFVRIAKRPLWLAFFFLVPVINIILSLLLLMDILRLLKKNRWLILFFLIPGINIFILWYLAISRVSSFETSETNFQ